MTMPDDERSIKRSCDLVIMAVGPLNKLALADRLDLLLCFDGHVYIPDEVEFEAVYKHAWEHETPLGPDKLRLQAWIAQQTDAGRVSCVKTLVGEIAKNKRDSGEYAPSKRNHRMNTGELAARDFFNNRKEVGHKGKPALMLMYDGKGFDEVWCVHNLDVNLLLSFSMLVALDRILIEIQE